MKGAVERGRRGGSQHVRIWQSFAEAWLTQRHCAPVIAALQRQMKLSAGRWLYSDSRSALSPQSLENKYVGFQSCQGRRWTVGQEAKRGAKAFPSPHNLFSMSPVTSSRHSFSVSHPKGPGAPDLTRCMQREALWACLFSLPVHLCVWSQRYPPQREATQFKPFMMESGLWRWNYFSSLSQSEKKYSSLWWSQNVTVRAAYRWWNECWYVFCSSEIFCIYLSLVSIRLAF